MGAFDLPHEIAPVDRLLRARRASRGTPYVVGVTGPVACGKSTTAAALRELARHWPGVRAAALVSTDGYLFPNRILEARGLTMRKGFPETYDLEALAACLEGARRGPVTFRGYCHGTYDVDSALDQVIDRPEVLIVEGLALGSHAVRPRLDTLVYLDAAQGDVEEWYVARFMALWRAAEGDPASFYRRFRSLDAAGAADLARTVWAQINLPNIRQNILPARALADIVVRKGPDHRVVAVQVQSPGAGDARPVPRLPARRP